MGMGVFSWILLGLIAGALAKFIMPGERPRRDLCHYHRHRRCDRRRFSGGSFIGIGKVESFDLGGIFIAIIGAIILLIVYRLLRKRT